MRDSSHDQSNMKSNELFIENLQFLAEKQFQISTLRSMQAQVFSNLLQKKSGLLVLPTGGGKSLLYQLWAAALEQQKSTGLVLVISPLVALMQDQVDQAQKFGIRATCLNATLSAQERQVRLEQIEAQKIQLLFVTPERFRKSEFLKIIQKLEIQLFVVDEAHCIASWGHDFRPDYTRLGEIRAQLGQPLTLALTATATQGVQKEILTELQISDGFCFVDSVARPELGLFVHEVHGLDEKIRSITGLRFQQSGAMIVYGSLISTLQRVRAELLRLGIESELYHGQLSGSDRKKIQRRFLADPNALLLATPAFGLGINKSDIRSVIHLEIPIAIEAYYQEVGRAGRDGQAAQTHLLLDIDDVSIQMEFIKWGNPDKGFVQSVARLIEKNSTRVYQEGADFLREQLNFYNRRDFRVETSLNLLEKWGCLEVATGTQKNRLGFLFVKEPSDSDLLTLKTEQRIKTQNQKLHQMLDWAQNTESCRQQRILNYFTQELINPCGVCDVCLRSKGLL